jgi:hypothetical protein
MQYCDIHHVRYDDYCRCPACEDEDIAADERRKQTSILQDISEQMSSRTSKEAQLEAEILRLKHEIEELKRRR